MNNNIDRDSNNTNQLSEYWCHTCEFYHTDSEQDYRNKICSYCNQHKSYLQLHPRTVYYKYGFCKREVLQCSEYQKEEAGSFKVTHVLTDAKSDSDIYESICQAIEELCSKSGSNHVINYYDAVRAAYLNKTQKLSKEYFLMTIRDYLLGQEIKDVNKIDKNLEVLWPFTYDVVNTEERIKIVNKDPDNLVVSWVDSCSGNDSGKP